MSPQCCIGISTGAENDVNDARSEVEHSLTPEEVVEGEELLESDSDDLEESGLRGGKSEGLGGVHDRTTADHSEVDDCSAEKYRDTEPDVYIDELFPDPADESDSAAAEVMATPKFTKKLTAPDGREFLKLALVASLSDDYY